MAHNQLRFNLLNRIHSHTHHNEQRGPSKVKSYP